MIGFVLNIPYTLIGLMAGLISLPYKIQFRVNPYVLIVNVKKLWWTFGYLKNARAVTIGQVILLGSNIEDQDLEHELVHVEQYQQVPLIQPILYGIELIRKGYKNNKYEIEAYQKAGNVYKEKIISKTLKFEDKLVKDILEGRKTATWRLFDDKDLKVGDKLELINFDLGKKFAEAEIVNIKEKKLGEVDEGDYVGHAKDKDRQVMLEGYKGYYGDKVTFDTVVKIIDFKLL